MTAFVVSGGLGSDPLGLWETGGGSSSSGETRWTVHLPDDVEEGRDILRRRRDRLRSQRTKMQELRTSFSEPTSEIATSFSVGSHNDETEKIRKIVDRIERLYEATTRVDTERSGRVIAITRIAPDGALKTVLDAKSGANDAELHRAGVSHATETRLAQVELFGDALSAAAAVASALALPGGQVQALPVVWRLIQRALAEHS